MFISLNLTSNWQTKKKTFLSLLLLLHNLLIFLLDSCVDGVRDEVHPVHAHLYQRLCHRGRTDDQQEGRTGTLYTGTDMINKKGGQGHFTQVQMINKKGGQGCFTQEQV